VSYTRQPADFSSVSRPVSEGWYTKRRDQAQTTNSSPEFQVAAATDQQTTKAVAENAAAPVARRPIEALPLTPVNSGATSIDSQSSLAAAPVNRGRVVLEWNRGDSATPAARQEMTDVALNDRTTTLR
jgi:hypothetical protein